MIANTTTTAVYVQDLPRLEAVREQLQAMDGKNKNKADALAYLLDKHDAFRAGDGNVFAGVRLALDEYAKELT